MLAPGMLRAQTLAKPTGQVIAGISREPTVFNALMPHIEVDERDYFQLYNPLWVVDLHGAQACRGSRRGLQCRGPSPPWLSGRSPSQPEIYRLRGWAE